MNYYKNIYHLAKINTEDKFIELMSKRKPLDEVIADEIIELSGRTKEEVLSKGRKDEIITIRQMIHFSLTKLTSLTDEEIGFKYGGLDHATIINSAYRIQGYIDTKDSSLYPYKNFLTRNKLM